jgi:hypothetical protein
VIANGFFCTSLAKYDYARLSHRHFSCYSLPGKPAILLSLNRAPGSGIRLGLVRSSSASYSASISVGVRRAVPDLVLTTFEWLARRGRLGKVDKLG